MKIRFNISLKIELNILGSSRSLNINNSSNNVRSERILNSISLKLSKNIHDTNILKTNSPLSLLNKDLNPMQVLK